MRGGSSWSWANASRAFGKLRSELGLFVAAACQQRFGFEQLQGRTGRLIGGGVERGVDEVFELTAFELAFEPGDGIAQSRIRLADLSVAEW